MKKTMLLIPVVAVPFFIYSCISKTLSQESQYPTAGMSRKQVESLPNIKRGVVIFEKSGVSYEEFMLNGKIIKVDFVKGNHASGPDDRVISVQGSN